MQASCRGIRDLQSNTFNTIFNKIEKDLNEFEQRKLCEKLMEKFYLNGSLATALSSSHDEASFLADSANRETQP